MAITHYSHQIEDILKQFSDEDIISLSITITGGLLKNKIHSRQDAVKVIIGYSEDLQSILRRKLFTKDRLLTYLYEKNVPIKLPINKPEIIKKILLLWRNESGNVNQKSSCDFTDWDQSSEQSSMNEDSSDVHRDIQDTHEEYPSENQEEKNLVMTQKNSEDLLDSGETNIQSTILALAEKFSEWWFSLYNTNELTGDHFFPDASLNLVLSSEEASDSNNISSDPVGIADCLLTTKNKYELYFNPNLTSEGITGKMDAHGLVMVMVYGTLHSKSICVGVFEQLFALARDPYAENNWKVKRTDLKLKSSNSCYHPPKLCDSNTNSNSENMLEMT